jgi:excisionase family DNA binding protein
MTTPPDPDSGLSVDEVAELWRVRPMTVRRLIYGKKLKAVKVGNRVIITRAELARYRDANPA